MWIFLKKVCFFGNEIKTEKIKKINILILNKKYCGKICGKICGKTKKIIMEKSSKLLIS